MTTKYDVAIIGAGAAGLAAARLLSGANRRVCVIEARERVGGRVHSLHVPDLPLPIELGAEFIHGEGSSSFSIVDAAALPVAEIPDDHWWSRDGAREKIEDYWNILETVRGKISARTKDLSFDAFLKSRRDLTPRMRELGRTFVEGYHAAHADRMSALALRAADSEQEEPSGNRQFRLGRGQDSLLEWLRAGCDPERVELLLNRPVTRVQWAPGNVTIDCGTTIRAKRLILTIPIGVWKAGAIEFDPPLREKQRALDVIEPGHVVKIAFRFRERFWDDVNFLHASDRYVQTWWSSAPFRSPILTAWAGGHAADALLAEAPDARVGRALDSMSAAWGIPRRRLEANLAGTWSYDWQRDPFSRCAYSYAAVGGANAANELARPIRKTLFFAGEATSSDETGTVAGAIESGRRAASEALRG